MTRTASKSWIITGTSTRKLRNVMPTNLLVRILASEFPLDGAARSIASLLLRVEFALKELSTGDGSVKALATEAADLDLRHVQPICMLGRSRSCAPGAAGCGHRSERPGAGDMPHDQSHRRMPEFGVLLNRHTPERS